MVLILAKSSRVLTNRFELGIIKKLLQSKGDEILIYIVNSPKVIFTMIPFLTCISINSLAVQITSVVGLPTIPQIGLNLGFLLSNIVYLGTLSHVMKFPPCSYLLPVRQMEAIVNLPGTNKK